MPSRKGQGKPVTPSEKRRYDQLREAGWSPEAAAESVGRSKSWAYLYEADKRGENGRLRVAERGTPKPSRDLSEAVDLIVTIKTAKEKDAYALVDRFEDGLYPFVADVAWFLANVQADKLNDSLGLLLAETPMADELRADPITPTDILRTIPKSMDRHFRGLSAAIEWMPARAEAWMERLVEIYPELQEVETETRAVLESQDPVRIKALMAQVWGHQESA